MHTLICVSIMVDDDEAALRDADEAKRAGADLVEWRVDEVFHGEGDDHGTQRVDRLVAQSPLPCIVTCRPTWEGGSYDGDDAARVALFERLGTSDNPPRYIDVELAAYTRSENLRRKVNLAVDHPEQRRDVHTSLILSIHDFDGRPADLSRRLLTMRDELAARVTKVAFRARSLRDNLELFDLPAQQGRPTIALGMGEFGVLSRVLAPKFGGFLTFASLRPAEATAPGQPTVDELLNIYRFREIGPDTRVYGVIGYPLGHSLSPRVHNAGFAQRGIDAVYLPMPIVGAPDPETSYASFKATVGELVDHPGLDFAGASVTQPHKQNLVRFARERGWTIDATAEAIGAGNTLSIARDSNGAIVSAEVANTDAPAAAACLKDAMGGIDGKRVAIFGAGGVARAVAYGAAQQGAHVSVFSRTPEPGERLASELGRTPRGSIQACSVSKLDPSAFSAIVNCTPIGMAGGPEPEGNIVPEAVFAHAQPGTVFFDTVYTPELTPMLRESLSRGFAIIRGTEMFVRQAVAQFSMWTGGPPPTELFNQLVRTADGHAEERTHDMDAEQHAD